MTKPRELETDGGLSQSGSAEAENDSRPASFAAAGLESVLSIFRAVDTLLSRVRLSQAVRLIGVSVSGLGPARAGQLSLLEPDALRRERLAQAVDRLASRFGEKAIRPASLIGRRRRDRNWPPEGQDR